MVLVEEIADDEVEVKDAVQQGRKCAQVSLVDDKVKAEPALRRGFLDHAAEPLYPPEGSPEGVVAPETKKAHADHEASENLNDQMNRGAKDNNGLEPPEWYTKEYPKGCQYNSPGCTLQPMEMSVHGSDLKKQMVRGTRWEEATARGLKALRLSFMSICDEDITDLVATLKHNTDVTELDISHNSIKDVGVQTLVGALANGAAPNLQELRAYNNEFGELGEIMLTKGLPVFRKKLKVYWQEPPWAHLGKNTETSAAATAAA